jgi:hypothetical protein
MKSLLFIDPFSYRKRNLWVPEHKIDNVLDDDLLE